MMHGAEKSGLVIVAGKPAGTARPRGICGDAECGGAGGAKGGDQGECGVRRETGKE